MTSPFQPFGGGDFILTPPAAVFRLADRATRRSECGPAALTWLGTCAILLSNTYLPGGHGVGRVKVNLTLEAGVAQEARALGLNMSRLAETAIAEAARQERNRQWREENRAALDSYAEEVARDGLPLAGYRSF